MTGRSARSAMRTISPPHRAALCSVLAAVGLALSPGFASASGTPAHAHTADRARASAVARCRHTKRSTASQRSACRAYRAARLLDASRELGLTGFTVALALPSIPTVTITSGPADGSASSSTRASFAFSSAASRVSFQCAIDSKRYSGCSSPAAYSGLARGSHTFKVYAVARGLRGAAATVSWTVATAPSDTTAPSKPQGLVATAGDARVALSWSPSSDNVGVAGYRVFRDASQVAQVTATSFTDTGLTDGDTYTYAVKAFDAAGNVSAQSAAVSATPLAAPSSPSSPAGSGGNPPLALTTWVAASGGLYTPRSDQAAAAEVIAAAENRPGNSTANGYMPTAAQLQAFYSAINSNGQTVVQANPYDRFVTGHYSGTTDEVIQWAAAKWGIPADWLRAEYVQESRWNMSQLGDLATVTPTAYSEYPSQARVPNTDEVYQSMGISQIKWIPDGSVGAGTEPLRWESTAFNADYQAATLRFYFDDPDGLRSAWGDSTYSAGNAWDSLGGWFEPYPWLNSGQLSYIAEVQAHLAARTWAQPGF